MKLLIRFTVILSVLVIFSGCPADPGENEGLTDEQVKNAIYKLFPLEMALYYEYDAAIDIQNAEFTEIGNVLTITFTDYDYTFGRVSGAVCNGSIVVDFNTTDITGTINFTSDPNGITSIEYAMVLAPEEYITGASGSVIVNGEAVSYTEYNTHSAEFYFRHDGIINILFAMEACRMSAADTSYDDSGNPVLLGFSGYSYDGTTSVTGSFEYDIVTMNLTGTAVLAGNPDYTSWGLNIVIDG